MYNIIYPLSNETRIKSKWIEYVKKLLCSLGFSGTWYSQSFISKVWLVKAANMKLKDWVLQKWRSNIYITSNSNFYKMFKTNFQQNEYLKLLPTSLCRTFIRFCTRNHKLPVENCRWRSIALNERKCPLCQSDTWDEYHYLLACDHFNSPRRKYMKQFYYNRPNTFKLEQLMNTKNMKDLRQLNGRNTFLSSPHFCFIIVFICDLFVSRDDPLMSYKTFTLTEQLYVLSHDRSWGRGCDPVKPV